MLYLAEFCTGTGGFSLAFKSDCIATIYSNDYEHSSKVIVDANFDNKLILKNIHDIPLNTIPDVDVITSGFPCQPFSIAGEKLGFDDVRSNVFQCLIDIINHVRPRCVLFENVKNLVTHQGGQSFKRVLSEIENIGYHYKYKVLNTCDITTIPHNRERVFIVCFLSKANCDSFHFPDKLSDDRSHMYDISNYLEKNVDEKYYYDNRFKIWDTIKDSMPKHIDTNTVYQYRRGIVRQNKTNVCPTLTANTGTGGHNVPLIRDNYGIRKLTPRECFNLQGFPSHFILPVELSDSKLYKLAGNAISVSVVELLALNILNIIKND